MVRAGISLLGGGPAERPDPRLKAVATLTAPILDIRNLKPGDRVSYGNAFTATRPMRIAVADSMRRSWTRPLATVGISLNMEPMLAHRKLQKELKAGPALYALRALAIAQGAKSVNSLTGLDIAASFGRGADFKDNGMFALADIRF